MDDRGSPKRKDRSSSSSSSSQLSCKICNKKFYSSQALGGHQNAHRQERLLAKARSSGGGAHEMGTNSYLLDQSRPGTNPFYGGGLSSCEYRNRLGVSMNSMVIHKQSSLHPVTRSVQVLPPAGLSYWMQPPPSSRPPASKVFGVPKFGIVGDKRDNNNNPWNQPQASEELDLTLKL